MILLQISHLIKHYGNHLALNDVSISIPKGSIYGLLGPNGAGKTSIIRIINRISAQDSGEILFRGKIQCDSDIKKIGYLPEERGLYKKMKVSEHVLFLAQLKGLRKNQASTNLDYWFDKFQIDSWRKKKIEELSKGMQQKIQFIIAVIHDPDLLILDEPFSGFDPINTELLKNEILELRSQGKTIILSSHSMPSVEELCDEITLINRGKIVLQGKVQDIKNRYRDNIFEVLLRTKETIETSELFNILSLETVNNISKALLHKKSGVSNSLLITELASRYEIVSFQEKLPSMNDIFLKTVSE